MDKLFGELGPIDVEIDLIEAAIRLSTALALGFALGIERELRNKPAGLRSHMLVSLAAAILTLMTFAMVHGTEAHDSVRSDPTRLIEAVVSGVAFLGAGTIIRGRGGVEGITTGASLWLAGALGIASGIGYYKVAVMTTVMALAVLYLLAKAEQALEDRRDRPASRGG